MKPANRRYLFIVAALTIICAALQFIWNKQAPDGIRMNDGFILLGVFATTVTAAHFFLLSVSENAPNAFVRSFMVSTAIKLMIYMTVLIAFLLYSKDNQKVLVLHFLFYYAVFTVFEVSMLYRELSAKRKGKL